MGRCTAVNSKEKPPHRAGVHKIYRYESKRITLVAKRILNELYTNTAYLFSISLKSMEVNGPI